MRKIPQYLENPIDNIFIYFSEIAAPFYNKLKFTANTLTSISLILGLISSVLFLYDDYKLSALVFLLAYYFDCADGFYARKYKLTSKFGDMYDHFADYLKMGLILLLMFSKNSKKFFTIILPIFIVFGLLTTVQIGCQEKYKKDDDHGDMLHATRNMCKEDPENVMQISKYFGLGTLMLVFSILIFTYGDF